MTVYSDELRAWMRDNADDLIQVAAYLRANPRTWAMLVETARLEEDVATLREVGQ